MALLVTGGAGFIGSNFIIDWLNKKNEVIINLDKLTYAGNLSNLDSLDEDKRHIFVRGDISDQKLLRKILLDFQPRAIINFAAESHVDRSINQPDHFVRTNIIGFYKLLEVVKIYWNELSEYQKKEFRFLNISTDEVYGSLKSDAPAFSESSRYEPNSPYSASKASADHLVRAYHRTYGIPVITTNCSNNYGPRQSSEKLIPLIIKNALAHKALPVYGNGMQIRDWLYVNDHCTAIQTVLASGKPGESYNIGAQNEKTNINIVKSLCGLLDELYPMRIGKKSSGYQKLITFVEDRLGHDQRYSINTNKIEKNLGWKPEVEFKIGLRKTVEWYLKNRKWVKKSSLNN